MHWHKNFLKSFVYAAQGIREAFSERNFTIQFVVGVCAIVAAFTLPLASWERMIVILCTALVLASEAMNSAVERLLNFVSKQYLDEIRAIKDLMAGAVLIFSIAAFIIGIWIFSKYL